MSISEKQQSWVRVTLSCNPRIVENICADFFANGVEGMEEIDNGLIVYFEEKNWNAEKKSWMIDRIKMIDISFSANQIRSEPVDWEDWSESWKKNFSVFRVEPNIIIAPDWEEPQIQPGEHLVKISPKMAFGIGSHETTQLILSLLPENIEKGARVLDAGTGSGILAILSAKIGAGRITAFDNDPLATENARENAALNLEKDKIDIYTGYLADGPKNKYDLIIANINRNVLLDLSGQWSAFIKPEGKLILSGILETDENIIISAYENDGWKYINKKQKGEWAALVLVIG